MGQLIIRKHSYNNLMLYNTKVKIQLTPAIIPQLIFVSEKNTKDI